MAEIHDLIADILPPLMDQWVANTIQYLRRMSNSTFPASLSIRASYRRLSPEDEQLPGAVFVVRIFDPSQLGFDPARGDRIVLTNAAGEEEAYSVIKAVTAQTKFWTLTLQRIVP